MAGKTVSDCFANIESEISQLRQLLGQEQAPEEVAEIKGSKMVGRGRKRHEAPTFEAEAEDEEE